MPPRDKKVNELFSVSLELFAVYGYKKTTLEDIADRLGMTKSNLYFYVKNKKDLYEKTVESALVQWKEAVAETVASEAGCRERFRAMALASFRYIDQHPILRSLLMKDPSIFTLSPSEDRFAEINRKAITLIREILIQGIEEKVFYPMDVDSVAEYLFSVYVMFLIKTYVKPDSSSSHAMYTAALDLALRGLALRPDDTIPVSR